jgi:hypothetical protein
MTVTVDVAGFEEGFCPRELLPPHPSKAKRLNVPKTTSNAAGRSRRFQNPIQHKARAAEDPGSSGNDVGQRLEALELIKIVSVVIPGPAAGFTVEGEKLHDASGGSPEHAKEIF